MYSLLLLTQSILVSVLTDKNRKYTQTAYFNLLQLLEKATMLVNNLAHHPQSV